MAVLVPGGAWGAKEVVAVDEPRPDGEVLTADELGRIVGSLEDRLELQKRLTRLSEAFGGGLGLDPGQLRKDLVEGMRRCRTHGRPSIKTERRYRLLELLVVERLETDDITARLHISPRTYYRVRREGLAELALTMTEIWQQRSAVQTSEVKASQGAVASEGAPQPKVFLGREQEIERTLALLERHRMVMIGGPAGVGKSALGAAVAERLALSTPVLWLHLRPGLSDSIPGVFYEIGRRFAELGSGALAAFLAEVVPGSPWQQVAYGIAAHNLQQQPLAMIFDDGDVIAGNRGVCGLLNSLHSDCSHCLFLVLGRQSIPGLDGVVRMELAGLDPATTRAYLANLGVTTLDESSLAALHEQTGGNPHLLHLAAGALLHGRLDPDRLEEQLIDVVDVREYFFDHIFEKLGAGERTVLAAVALMRQASTASFLSSAIDSLTPDVPGKLAELGRRYLLSSNEDGLRLHSTIRGFVRRSIGHAEAEELHRRLGRAYSRVGRFDDATHHWLQVGDLAEAKRALLNNRAEVQPHVQARLVHLLVQLEAAGLADDPDIASFRRALHRRGGEHGRSG